MRYSFFPLVVRASTIRSTTHSSSSSLSDHWNWDAGSHVFDELKRHDCYVTQTKQRRRNKHSLCVSFPFDEHLSNAIFYSFVDDAFNFKSLVVARNFLAVRLAGEHRRLSTSLFALKIGFGRVDLLQLHLLSWICWILSTHCCYSRWCCRQLRRPLPRRVQNALQLNKIIKYNKC